jgi:hypothetical protein
VNQRVVSVVEVVYEQELDHVAIHQHEMVVYNVSCQENGTEEGAKKVKLLNVTHNLVRSMATGVLGLNTLNAV